MAVHNERDSLNLEDPQTGRKAGHTALADIDEEFVFGIVGDVHDCTVGHRRCCVAHR